MNKQNELPDWSESNTGPGQLWKNPLRPMSENLQIADGAIHRRDLIIKNLQSQLSQHQTKLDALLAHCPISECEVCSTIICDHKDPMHFHHDGCPSCAQFEEVGLNGLSEAETSNSASVLGIVNQK